MAHESTVSHENNIEGTSDLMASRSRSYTENLSGVSPETSITKRKPLQRADSLVPNLYANTPKEITQILEFDEEDDAGTTSSKAEDDDEEN